MIGYHISEHARQKILKEIAIRAQKHVLDMTYNWYYVFAHFVVLSLIHVIGASSFLFSRRFELTLRTFCQDSNLPSLIILSPFFSLQKPSLPHAKPWKCNLSLWFVRLISSLWSIHYFPSADHLLAISTKTSSSVLDLLRPLLPCRVCLCLSGRLLPRSAMQALSSARALLL